ncbi:sensor histidine kinase LiaS [Lentibacillus kapialis]|uniref:Sensor histidine kinase n=1 Tax=Lentibacillus kapialis TaxID=340214 RepID=A0A917UXB2_9BACI|nr:sensor histidine kinase [Lentibacillus kapialis]GGJ92161.1 sensor histidine kinase LiaS [Lentibacillus kapialis]
MKKLSSIRYLFIRSHLYAVLLTTIMLLTFLLSIYVIVSPDWLTGGSLVVFMLFYILFGIAISFYAGFKSGGKIKDRLDNLSVMITQFANGHYDYRAYFNERDEIARVSSEMNELGEKLQNQVRSLKRMADAKADYANSAHKAAVIEERQRLARELHDAVSQQLFALTMMSEAAVRQVDKQPKAAGAQIREVAETALKAQSEMRALLLHLRPVHLSGDGLADGIKRLVGELKQKTQLDFTVQIESDLELSEAVEEHLFRIVQEALSNILRHAGANSVKVELFTRSNGLFLHIRDDGQGFDAEEDKKRKTSYGLKTMTERTEELGGVFKVRSIRGEGTYIDIHIPSYIKGEV